MRRRLAVLALAALAAACAPRSRPAAEAAAPAPAAAGALAIEATQVPLSEANPALTTIGELTYAGGLALTARDARFGGLSGLDQTGDGLLAATDSGDLLRFKVRRDRAGKLTGVTGAALLPLHDEQGRSLSGEKTPGDAEGLAVLSDGAFAVSFEQRHRIALHADLAAPGRLLTSPDPAAFGSNEGMEALADVGTDPAALLVGSEGGRLWLCPAAPPAKGAPAACGERPLSQPFDREFKLTGLDRAHGPDGSLVAVFRAFDPLRGARIVIAELRPEGDGYAARELGRLAAPLTVDNFEAIVIDDAPRPNGARRLYLLSDDNFSSRQRTLLLAFDWRPRA